jgi:hypothetical protein
MKKLLLAALAAALWCIPAFAQQTTASLSNPVGGNIFAAGANCANVSVCIWQKLPTTATTTTVTITGTFSATLIVESSADGGTTWTQQSSQTAPAVVTFTTTSLTDVRVRCSAFVSGIASANIQTAGNQINVTASSGGATGSTFYAATSCAGLANCVTLVDDDTTDNCGTAFTNWIASINAFTGPGFAQIYFIGSGTGKGFLFKTCRIVITVSHEVTNQATLDFGSTQTPANCIQQGAGTLTSGYSTGGVSIDWRFHGGYLTGCTGATTAGMESMPGWVTAICKTSTSIILARLGTPRGCAQNQQ